MTDENPLPNRSVFSIIRLPGIENMSEDLTRARLGQSNLTRGMSSFSKLVAELARQPEPNRSINYRLFYYSLLNLKNSKNSGYD